MDDITAIQQVLVRYGHCVDDRDFAGLDQVFTPDARASYSGGPWLEGLGAIIASISPLANFPASLHLMGNMLVTVDGDQATSDTRSITQLVESDGTTRVRTLRYRDRWRRTPAGWRIVERVHRAQFAFTATAELFA
jgi:hypothetical protein